MIETIDAQELFKTAVNLIENDGDKEEIGKYLLKAFSLNNNLIGLNLALGDFFSNILEIYKSYYFYKRELELHPYREQEIKEHIYFMLAWNASYLGKPDEAVQYMQEAFKLNNSRSDYYSNLIYMANHAYEINDSELANIAKTFYINCLEKQLQIEREIIQTKLSKKQYFKNTKTRIGILSSHIHSQSAEVLLLNIFKNIDHIKYEFYCYYLNDVITIEDNCTQGYRDLSQSFINIKNKTPLEIADLIVDDDILIDTLGHVKNNCLNIFSLKPAPIQISTTGYWGSTGLPQMDYLIVQKGWTKPEEALNYTEKIIEVEHSYFIAKYKNINIVQAPCERKGFVTFGCFNRGQKINSKVLSIWSILLNLLPDSKIVLSYPALKENDFREDVFIFFESQGINRTRVALEGNISTEQYFHLYNEIDIALDPFPFSGGCTTIDALWMGVPVITKKGNKTAGRFSESFLNLCKVPELISENEQDYILKALELGKDFNRIQNYKETLRGKVIESKISDPKAAAKHFEQALDTIIELERNKQKENALPERIPQ